ncbi:MAG: AMP-binding enzyme, partial [Nocardioidaceae bacterium]
LVWVRSPYVCLGYDGPDGPLTRGADGFVTVGDRGSLRDGILRLQGRGDETVVTAGATVLVAEVEAALEEATGHRVAVVGLPHPDLGQVLCGVVTDRDSLPALRAAARSSLPPGQRPRRWFEVPAPPLTAAGKLDREKLASMLMASEEVRARA